MYQIRVWKYLDNNTKRLIELEQSDNLDFIKEVYKIFKELYTSWNSEIEKVGF